MSPRVKIILHSAAAAALALAAIVLVIWLGRYLAGVFGVRPNKLDRFMLVASGLGFFAGVVVFFGYR